ncbi:MAG: response regulator transcription factor [Chloroflexi bacterium]|nr:response regulator transcription factor [Chloroflexota bacterium]
MKILVIDDDPDVVEVVSLTFEMRWPDAVTVSANDGSSGVDMVEIENPDIIILDIGLPDMDGFEVCREIRRFSDVPIVMLTVRDKEADVVKGLQLGADDYVTKPFKHIELLARVQAVLRRAQMEPVSSEEEPFQSGAMVVDFARREVTVKGEVVKLTPTEYQLLYHLVKNAGRVLSHRTLLGRIWGREYVDETNYLKVHVQHLRQKLGDDPADPTMIVTERGAGYKFARPS